MWSLSDSFNDSNRCSRESYLPELSDLNSHTRNQTVIILTLFWVHSDHAQAILFLRFISALGYNSHHHVRLLTSFRAPAHSPVSNKGLTFRETLALKTLCGGSFTLLTQLSYKTKLSFKTLTDAAPQFLYKN